MICFFSFMMASLPSSSTGYEASMERICIICDKPHNTTSIDIDKAKINTLINSSKKRCDNKYFKFLSCTQLTVHKSCFNHYNEHSRIETARKKNVKKINVSRQSNVHCNNETVKDCCFFCYRTSKVSIRKVLNQQTIDNIIDEINSKPLTTHSRNLLARLCNFSAITNYNDVNIWYHTACFSSFYSFRTHDSVGRPVTENMSELLEFIIDTITGSDECQFSLREILDDYKGEKPIKIQAIITQIKNHFQDEVLIVNRKKDYIILFVNSEGFILDEEFYRDRENDPEKEKILLCETVGKLIVKEIRSRSYDTTEYKAPCCFLDSAKEEIPPTLKTLLDVIIKSKKKKVRPISGKTL